MRWLLRSAISLESMTYTGITYKDPEYRILEPIVDDDMCSVMMRMRLEKEFSAEECICRAVGKFPVSVVKMKSLRTRFLSV